jgi:hypothetical protein
MESITLKTPLAGQQYLGFAHLELDEAACILAHGFDAFGWVVASLRSVIYERRMSSGKSVFRIRLTINNDSIDGRRRMELTSSCS